MLRSHEVDLYFRISALCHTAYTLRQVLPTGASCGSLQRGSNLSLQSLVQKSSCWVNHRPRWPRKPPLKARSRHLWWSKATKMLLILGRTCLVKFGQEQQQAGHNLQNLESGKPQGHLLHGCNGVQACC